MASTPNDNFYHQVKMAIGFWCKRGLNPRIDLLFNHQRVYQLS